MSEQNQASQIRYAPTSEVEAQVSKKPRLEIQGCASFTPSSSVFETDMKQQIKVDPKKSRQKHKQRKINLPDPCSPEDVLWQEIKYVLGAEVVEKAIEGGVEFDSPFSPQEEVEVLVKSLSPGGESLHSSLIRWLRNIQRGYPLQVMLWQFLLMKSIATLPGLSSFPSHSLVRLFAQRCTEMRGCILLPTL